MLRLSQPSSGTQIAVPLAPASLEDSLGSPRPSEPASVIPVARSCPLLKLPLELRYMIYDLLLSPEDKVVHIVVRGSSRTGPRPYRVEPFYSIKTAERAVSPNSRLISAFVAMTQSPFTAYGSAFRRESDMQEDYGTCREYTANDYHLAYLKSVNRQVRAEAWSFFLSSYCFALKSLPELHGFFTVLGSESYKLLTWLQIDWDVRSYWGSRKAGDTIALLEECTALRTLSVTLYDFVQENGDAITLHAATEVRAFLRMRGLRSLDVKIVLPQKPKRIEDHAGIQKLRDSLALMVADGGDFTFECYLGPEGATCSTRR